MGRGIYAVANWKMYKTARQATDYVEKLSPKIQCCKTNVYLAVPFTSIFSVSAFAKETCLSIGAQNMSDAKEGAFTGEVASFMLKEAGASFVLLGHSERRVLFGETNECIHRKVLRALQDDIRPILCIGETKKERDESRTEEVIEGEIVVALSEIPKEDAARLILAYEPVWAIGTGAVPTSSMIEKVHAYCRTVLGKLFGQKTAEKIPILYGGSINPSNVESIVSLKDVDGVLVGGASLDPEIFSQIVMECERIERK